jgi:catechol 2,3-dioxygenase-like lactoylglutathione lyase family enzyme
MRADDSRSWPGHLRPGALRFARTSRHYDETVAFYRDLIGLPVVGEFHESFGEDGTIFGLPDTTVQLEIVRAHADAIEGTFDQLVLYLDSSSDVRTATGRLRAAQMSEAEPHPYWAANGAVVYRDPDGRDVVFAPWV